MDDQNQTNQPLDQGAAPNVPLDITPQTPPAPTISPVMEPIAPPTTTFTTTVTTPTPEVPSIPTPTPAPFEPVAVPQPEAMTTFTTTVSTPTPMPSEPVSTPVVEPEMPKVKPKNKILPIIGGIMALLLVVGVAGAAYYVSNQLSTRQAVAPNAPTSKPKAGVVCGSYPQVECGIIDTSCIWSSSMNDCVSKAGGGTIFVCSAGQTSNQGCAAYGCSADTSRQCTCSNNAWSCQCVTDSSCSGGGVGGSGGGGRTADGTWTVGGVSCDYINNSGGTGPAGSPCENNPSKGNDYDNCGGSDCEKFSFKCGTRCLDWACGANVCSTPTESPTTPPACASSIISPAVVNQGQSVTVSSTSTTNANVFFYSAYNMDNLYGPGNAKPICVEGAIDYGDQCPGTSGLLIFSDINNRTDGGGLRTAGSVNIPYASLFAINDKNNSDRLVTNVAFMAYFMKDNGPVSPPDDNCKTYTKMASVCVPNGVKDCPACPTECGLVASKIMCKDSCNKDTPGSCPSTADCCPAAGTCPTACDYAGGTVPNGSCGITTCVAGSCPSGRSCVAGTCEGCPAEGTCPRTCGYPGGTIPNGSCGTTTCAVTPDCEVGACTLINVYKKVDGVYGTTPLTTAQLQALKIGDVLKFSLTSSMDNLRGRFRVTVAGVAGSWLNGTIDATNKKLVTYSDYTVVTAGIYQFEAQVTITP